MTEFYLGMLVIFLVILAVTPFLLFVFTSYEGPASRSAALRGARDTVLIGWAVTAIFNFFQSGFAFEHWNPSWFAGVAVAALIRLTIDLLVLNHARKRTA